MSRPQQAGVTRGELVPLGDRLRYLQIFRLIVVGLILAFWAFAPGLVQAPTSEMAQATGLFLLISLGSYLLWRLRRKRGLLLFGAMLLVDGVFLAWIVYASGGIDSSLRFIVVLHVVTVTLLASFRTGLKLALWHSMLNFFVFYAQTEGLFRPLETTPDGTQGHVLAKLWVFVAALWLVALGTASFSATNERELRRRRYDHEALAGMALAIGMKNSAIGVAEVALRSILDCFGFERGGLLGGLGENPSLMAYEGSGSPIEVREPDAVIRQAWKERRTLLINRLDSDTNPLLSALFPEARNLIVVPLFAGRNSIGGLVIEHSFSSGSRIEGRVVSMVEQFAAYAALTMRNTWLVEQMEGMASTDGLTGVANRRAFDRALKMEFSRASRTGGNVGIVLLDIDHFKSVNDTYGHQTGDEALRLLAGVLTQQVRGHDIVARYGGEEFAVIMPDLTEDACAAAAERLRLSVAAAEFTVPLSVSTGVAVFPTHAADSKSLVAAADEALYESKEQGRNRTTVSKNISSQAEVSRE